MATTIDRAGPRPRRARRLLVALSRVAGGVALVAAALGSLTVWLIVPALVAPLRRWPFGWLPGAISHHLLALSLAGGVAVVLGRVLGPRLLRVGRRTVLFLRKFAGDNADTTQTNATITRALESVGGSWRLVTLDDQHLAPVGSDQREARRGQGVRRLMEHIFGSLLAVPGVLLLVAAVLGGLGFVVAVVTIVVGLRVFDGTNDQRWERLVFGEGAVPTVVSDAGAAFFVAIVLAVAALVIFVLLAPTLPVMLALRVSAADTLDDHGIFSRFRVDELAHIAGTRYRLRRASRRPSAPRMTVVTVEPAIWQEAVAGFAADSAVVLVDVSRPTDALRWEVEHLLTSRRPAVFVADAALVDSASRQLADLLAGQQILVYDSSRGSARTFGPALRAALERAARRPPASRDDPLAARVTLPLVVPDRPAPSRPATSARVLKTVVSGVVVVAVAALGLGVYRSTTVDWLKPRDAFSGTPAQSWGSAEAAIQLPAATAMPSFTADEVAAALDTVRQAMIAGRLDPRMLIDHDRSTLESLFSTDGRAQLDDMFATGQAHFIATMIAPGTALRDVPIRGQGTMKYITMNESGFDYLFVETDFFWAYPFVGTVKARGDHLVVIHDTIAWMFPSSQITVARYQGMVATDFTFAGLGEDCDLFAQDLVGLGPGDLNPAVPTATGTVAATTKIVCP